MFLGSMEELNLSPSLKKLPPIDGYLHAFEKKVFSVFLSIWGVARSCGYFLFCTLPVFIHSVPMVLAECLVETVAFLLLGLSIVFASLTTLVKIGIELMKNWLSGVGAVVVPVSKSGIKSSSFAPAECKSSKKACSSNRDLNNYVVISCISQ